MQLEIKQYSEIQKSDWDNFVYSNRMGWAYHLYDVVLMNKDPHLINISFCVVDKEDNDKIYMLVQLHKSDSKKPILLSEWGFIVKDNLPPKTSKKVKKHLKVILMDT